VMQLLAESLLLSLAGGAAGTVLAAALTRALAALDPLKIPRVQDITLDGRVLAFTAAISILTGIVFGIVPALQSARADLQPVLKEGGRDSRSGSGWLRRALVVAEVAASVALIAAALLLARSPDSVSMVRAYADVGRRLRESVGVRAAGGVTGLPLATTRGDWSVV